MATWGAGYQPGGAWQRAMTFKWLARIGPILAGGNTVPFEGQMRIAFIREAFPRRGSGTHVLSVQTKTSLANAVGHVLSMLEALSWAR